MVDAPGYTLALAKKNGKILGLVDHAAGRTVARSTSRCLWGAIAHNESTYIGACSFAPSGARRFSYRWASGSATLTLTYRAPRFGTAVVTVSAHATYVDLRLKITNRGSVLTRVPFPEGMAGDTRTVTAGYAPNVLPGVRLKPGFFSRVGNDVEIYPSRWAFADYLALDAGAAHLSVYSVAHGPLPPVQLGFLHLAAPAPCSGTSFCIVHEFQTWIPRGTTWTSPVVRIRTGDTAEQSILAYRHDNAIDGYPSLQSKLGARLATLARAPLIKANLALVKPFREWAGELSGLPSPALLHPVAFQRGAFDENDPDFLPPDPRYGTTDRKSTRLNSSH